jgi:hypothetical protein
MDITRIGEGIDCFPGVDPDHLAISRRLLFDVFGNPMIVQWLSIRNAMKRSNSKHRIGLSAKSRTAIRRGKRLTPLRRRYELARGEGSYAEKDLFTRVRLDNTPSQRVVELFGRAE